MTVNIQKSWGDIVYREICLYEGTDKQETECEIFYGGLRGMQLFSDTRYSDPVRAALDTLDIWSERRINEIAKELEHITRLRRYVLKRKNVATKIPEPDFAP